ncbi:MAG TPA: hypothetical protein VHH34_05225, partial [Pseudonocardiaceae bacterium]|nr:hypothetical protein [Pseudonocardiaceae bacterium]
PHGPGAGLVSPSPARTGSRYGVGTTASCVAPDSDGLVVNGRAPQSGTAAHATREVGSAPNPTTHGVRVEENGPEHKSSRDGGANRVARAGNGAPTGSRTSRRRRDPN